MGCLLAVVSFPEFPAFFATSRACPPNGAMAGLAHEPSTWRGAFLRGVLERSRHRHRCCPACVSAPIVTGAETQAGRLVPRQGWPSGSGIKHGGDGFDLYELAVIAEHGDTHQCAGHVVVTERVPDHLPRRHQVLPPVRGNENAGADDIVQ